MKPEESHAAPDATPAPQADSAPRRNRPLKKLAIGFLLAVLVYLLSYGPAVTGALNRYGRLSPRAKTILCTVYTPAHWLADHSEIYGGYRLFWVRQSRNYQWWLNKHDPNRSHELLPPSRQARTTAPATGYQPPIPEPAKP